MPVITLDDREDPRLKAEFDRQTNMQPHITIKVQRMEYGDIAFTGYGPDGPCRIAFERKKLRDILTCMGDARFNGHQLPGLVLNYAFYGIIIEDTFKEDPDTGILVIPGPNHTWRPASSSANPSKAYRYEQLQHYILSCRLQAGCHLELTQSIPQTVRTVLHWYDWFNRKTWAEHTTINTMYTQPSSMAAQFTDASLTRMMAAQIDAVGAKRSDLVSQHFANPTQMVLGGMQDWTGITEPDGKGGQKRCFGPVVAQRIMDALAGETNGRSLKKKRRTEMTDEG